MKCIPAKALFVIGKYAEALDQVREEVEPSSNDFIPYLGQIPIHMGGELIGFLDDPDGMGFDFYWRQNDE